MYSLSLICGHIYFNKPKMKKANRTHRSLPLEACCFRRHRKAKAIATNVWNGKCRMKINSLPRKKRIPNQEIWHGCTEQTCTPRIRTYVGYPVVRIAHMPIVKFNAKHELLFQSSFRPSVFRKCLRFTRRHHGACVETCAERRWICRYALTLTAPFHHTTVRNKSNGNAMNARQSYWLTTWT